MINLRQGNGTRSGDQIPLRAMGPAFFNEYKARADYYDAWLKNQLGEKEPPDDPKARHSLIIRLRSEAYERLCDEVYKEKGYTSDGIPLPETLKRLDLLDEQAWDLLCAFGIERKERKLSN
jgi:hypothetical protein